MGCCTSLPLPRCLDRFINRRHPNINYDINRMYSGSDSHLFIALRKWIYLLQCNIGFYWRG